MFDILDKRRYLNLLINFLELIKLKVKCMLYMYV